MNARNRLAFIFLAALAAGAWWLNNRLHPAQAVVERPAPDGFYMTGAEITAPDAAGLPQYRLIAEEIRQVALGGETLLRETGIPAGEVAYLGDDTPDVAAMRMVGLPATVADGHPDALAASAWVSTQPGGRGAVREFCELLLGAR